MFDLANKANVCHLHWAAELHSLHPSPSLSDEVIVSSLALKSVEGQQVFAKANFSFFLTCYGDQSIHIVTDYKHTKSLPTKTPFLPRSPMRAQLKSLRLCFSLSFLSGFFFFLSINLSPCLLISLSLSPSSHLCFCHLVLVPGSSSAFD